MNRSRIRTTICVPLTSNLKWEGLPTSLTLPSSATGLEFMSVAKISEIQAVDESQFIESVGRIPQRFLDRLFERLDLILGRT